MKRDENDKKIKLLTGEEIGTTALGDLGTQHVGNFRSINPATGEVKLSTFNNDLASTVFTGNELSVSGAALTSRPQSGILGALEALEVRTAGYMHNGSALITKPIEDVFTYGGRPTVTLPGIFTTTGPTESKQSTEKEIEELRKEISSLQKNSMTPEQQIEKLMELMGKKEIERKKQQEESISLSEKMGLEIIQKKLINGAIEDWRCKKCGGGGTSIEIFKGIEGTERIKKYLKDFKEGKLAPCDKYPNDHFNWFEINENGMTFGVRVTFNSVFRPKVELN